MGRPRKVVDISTGKIGKKERVNRKIQESKIRTDNSDLQNVPGWLNDTAAGEYRRIVSEAADVGMLDNLDKTYIAIYADAYSKLLDANEHLKDEGMLVESGKATSPHWKIYRDCVQMIHSASTKLGLAVTDRLKLIVPTKEEKSVNKFLKYM